MPQTCYRLECLYSPMRTNVVRICVVLHPVSLSACSRPVAFKPLLYQNIDIRSAWISPSMTFPPAPPRDVACENDDVRPLEIKSLKVAVQV